MLKKLKNLFSRHPCESWDLKAEKNTEIPAYAGMTAAEEDAYWQRIAEQRMAEEGHLPRISHEEAWKDA